MWIEAIDPRELVNMISMCGRGRARSSPANVPLALLIPYGNTKTKFEGEAFE